jgi:hypothetical protein
MIANMLVKNPSYNGVEAFVIHYNFMLSNTTHEITFSCNIFLG